MKNFGLIKKAYAKIMVEGFVKNDNEKKKIYADFVKKLKTNPTLKKQNELYSLLEDISGVEDKDAYINECLSEVNDTLRESFTIENIKLLQPLFENNINIHAIESYPQKDLNESITNILHLKRNKKDNVSTIVESKKIIKEYTQPKKIVRENRTVLPTKVILETALTKISKTYSDLDETEMRIVESVITNDLTEQKNIFDETVKECLAILEKLKDESNNLEQYDSVLSKLNEMEYEKEVFTEEITKLSNLKKSLQ